LSGSVFDRFLFKFQMKTVNHPFFLVYHSVFHNFLNFIFLNVNQINQTKPVLPVFIITERISSIFESMLASREVPK
jgi:hypothetical protein